MTKLKIKKGAELQNPKTQAYRTLRLAFRGMITLYLLLFAGFLYYAYTVSKNEEFLYLTTVADLSASSLNSNFYNHEQTLKQLSRALEKNYAQRGESYRYRANDIRPLLAKVIEIFPDLRAVNLMGVDGKLIATTETFDTDTHRRDAAFSFNYLNEPSFSDSLQQLKSGMNFQIARPIFGTINAEWLLPFRHSVRDQKGNLVMLISATMPMNQQQSIWKGLTLSKGTSFGIFNDQFYLLSRYPAPARIAYVEAYHTPRTGSFANYLLKHNYPANGKLEGYNSTAKENFIFAFHRLSKYPLTAFASTPLSQVYARWWIKIQFPLVLVATTLIVSLIFYRILYRRQISLDRRLFRAQAMLRHQANHDTLTNLPNRSLVRERLEAAMLGAEKSGTLVGLLFIDIDHFKLVNDALGHPIGDKLLKAVSARLKGAIRENDTLARLGGDEFLIILNNMKSYSDIVKVSSKIVNIMRPSFKIETYELSNSISLGVAVYPDDGLSYEALLRKADTAMYRVKESGRDGVLFFNEGMNEMAEKSFNIRSMIVNALESGQFVLYYQPRLHLALQITEGMQVFPYIQHPEKGLIHPDEFITVAEESGLMLPIGQALLKQACRQLKEWRMAGKYPDLTLCTKVCALQLRRPDFVLNIMEILKENELPASALELEIKEHIYFTGHASIQKTIETLCREGVKLTITAAPESSAVDFEHIEQFDTPHGIKIKTDPTLIQNIASPEHGDILILSMIETAKNLNIPIIADGVEKQEEADFLRRHGCDFAQGRFYGDPGPQANFSFLKVEQV